MKNHITVTVKNFRSSLMGFRMTSYYFMHPGEAVPFLGKNDRPLGTVKCDKLADLLPMMLFALVLLLKRRAYFAIHNGAVVWNERCDCGKCADDQAGKEGA